MSGRDRERERERRAATSIRTNEYFVPKDGIDREVITADICRYLGNDALVRPGHYENPTTRQSQPGYFITAYRNLTTAMIADLKADSERWDAERRATRGPTSVEYRSSNTHQSRQHFGPSTENANVPIQGSPYPPATAAGGGGPQEVYPGYSSGGYPPPPASGGYSQNNGGYTQPPDNYAYIQGGNLVSSEPMEPRGRGVVPMSSSQTVPRTGYPSTQPPAAYTDSRGNLAGYYAQNNNQSSSAPQYSGTQAGNPYYDRVVPVTGAYVDPQDDYDNRGGYQESPQYAQPQMPSTTAPAANQGARRGDRDSRDPDPRDRHGHRSNRR